MQEKTLQYIIHEVTNNPSNGIAIQNAVTGNWDVPFSTAEKLHRNGINSVEACLNDAMSKARNDINVYLKRRSGTSSDYLLDEKKERIVVLLKPRNNTNADVSKNVATAAVAKSTVASTLSNHPTIPTDTMSYNQQNQHQPTGLLGGMDQMQVMDMYTDHKQYASVLQELQTVKAELLQVKSENERYKFDNYKLESRLELRSDKKPWVSDQLGAMVMENAPIIIEKMVGKTTGLAGAAPQEQFSDVKTTMLQMVKDKRFTDQLCQFLLDINNKIAATPGIEKELEKLIQ